MLVAGVDEAGRGPLAGPVVAAAVIFPRDSIIPGVNDSKALTAREREAVLPAIKREALAWAVSAASAAHIDRHGILPSLFAAMARSLARLKLLPDVVLVDGPLQIPLVALKRYFVAPPPCLAIVDGDARSHSIAAASIIAKTMRDRLMTRLDALHPEYGFARHKGYGTKAHLMNLRRLGATPHHRMSFSPLREPSLMFSDDE